MCHSFHLCDAYKIAERHAIDGLVAVPHVIGVLTIVYT